VNETENLNCCC